MYALALQAYGMGQVWTRPNMFSMEALICQCNVVYSNLNTHSPIKIVGSQNTFQNT